MEEKPYHCAKFDAEQGHDIEYTNIQTEWVHDVEVHDVRERTDHLSLETNGFKYVTYETELGTRFEEEAFRHDMEEIKEFVRDELQAEHAIHYDFRVSGKHIKERTLPYDFLDY
jgi:hypothetical protein